MEKQGLDKETRRKFIASIRNRVEVSLDEMVEEIGPYMTIYPDRVEDMYKREYVRGLIKSVKDDDGCPCYFSTKDDEETKYVNIDRCDNLDKLRIVKTDMNAKYEGLRKSVRKIERRCYILEGQISMQEYMHERQEEAVL